MEKRKITIVATATNTNKVIMSDATTLRELKRDLTEARVSYTDMTFFEGLSKVELKSDDTILPHDVPYKGRITNELVIMLTNMNKKIKSGAMSRKEAYNYITKHGLQKKCVETFGRNFTQCSTFSLVDLINRHMQTGTSSKKTTPSSTPKVANSNVALTVEDVKKELKNMLGKGTIKDNIYNFIISHLNVEIPNETSDCPYSAQELDEMFKSFN